MFVYLRKKKLSQVVASVASLLGKVVLLLNGNSSNAKGSITDSSSNAYALTTSSTTITQVAYSPFGTTGGSIALDGSSKYSLPSTFNASTGILGNKKTTIEFWANITTVQAITAWVIGIIGNANSVAVNGRWGLHLNGAGATAPQNVSFWYTIGTGTAASITTTASIVEGTWNHIALTFDATTPASTAATIYVNGVGQSFTIDLSTHTSNSGVQYYLFGDYGYQSPLGYISNFRIVQSSSLVYIGNFTPPTAPLTAITGTQLLVNGTGYNNNNSFVDSSTNNLAITRSGTPSQGTFTPYQPNGWSGYFNGGSYLAGAVSNTSLAIPASTDFSIEAWVNLPSPTTEQYLMNYGKAGSGGNTEGWHIGFNGALAGQINFYLAGGNFVFGINTVPAANTWTHICIARVSGVIKLYVNGVASATTWFNTNGSYAIGAEAWGIGGLDNSSNGVPARLFATGYISNLRVVIGSSAYSANFVPPTTNLTAIANTKLLTLQDNRFVDNSGSNLSITAGGTPSIRAYSPITTQTAYNAALHGGSGYFNGSTDYLTVPFSTSLVVDSTSSFCVEAWYNTNSTANQDIFCLRDASGATAGWELALVSQRWNFAWDGSGKTGISGTSIVTPNVWSHVAVTYDGTTLRLFKDGILDASATNIISTTATAATLKIGVAAYTGGTLRYFSGNISNVRIVKGSAVYTTAFALPTAPLTAISGTSLLLNFANAQIIDAASKNDIQTVGSARVDTVTKKFSTGSMYFNGTTDYLKIPTTQELAFGSGDFTIEFWMYPAAVQATNAVLFQIPTAPNLAIQYYALTGFGVSMASVWTAYASILPTVGQWTHIAVVRSSGNVVNVFLNGVLVASATNAGNSGAVFVASNATVGSTGTGAYFNGYIDDLRITKSALYSSTFTPPALETSIKNDSNDPYFNKNLLVLQGTQKSVTVIPTNNNLIVDQGPEGLSITRNGSPYQGTFNPFETNWSVYLNGSSNVNVTMPALGTSVYTIEWYIYPTVAPTGLWYVQCAADILIGYNGSSWGMTSQGSWNNGAQSTTLPILNQWNHMAVVRSGTGAGQVQLYLNGQPIGSTGTNATNLVAYNWILCSGMTGYFNSFRVTKSVLYTAAFTPPTTMPVLANTVALLFNANRFVDLSTSNLVLTLSGTPTVQPFSPLAITSVPATESILFNAAEYLTIQATQANTIGTNTATIEFWMYPTAQDGYRRIVGSSIGAYLAGTFAIRYNNGSFVAGAVGSSYITTTYPTLNAWHHIAWVGVGGTSQTLYVDGVSVGTAGAYNLTETIQYLGGYYPTGGEYYQGYISNFRMVKGTAVYTSNFTVPTSPLTAIANTSFLISGTAGIVDSTGHANISTTGTPAVLNTISKFGNNSIYFNGSTDYLVAKNNIGAYDFGTGDFTIELWYYHVARTVSAPCLFSNYSTYTTGSIGLFAGHSSSGVTKYAVWLAGEGSSSLISTTNLTAGVWHHIAVSRSGTTMKLFVNGVAEATRSLAAGSSFTGSGGNISISNSLDASTITYLNGYVDEVRVTKGISRYNSNFSIPTAAFADNSVGDTYYPYVTLLLHGEQQSVTYPITTNSTFTDSSMNLSQMTKYSNPTQGSFSPFSPSGWCGYFDGSSHYMSCTANMTGVEATFEAWIKYEDNANQYNGAILFAQHTGGNAGEQYFGIDKNAYTLTFMTNTAFGAYNCNSGTSKITPYVWTHVALTLSSTGTRIFIDGKLVGYNATPKYWTQTSQPVYFGFGSYGPSYFKGQARDVRVLKGTALYLTDFTPSAAPLTAITNTAWLTLQAADNRLVDRSGNTGATGVALMQPNTSSSVTTAYSPSIHGASAYFDGASYINAPIKTPQLTFTGDFTIEAWTYQAALGTFLIIDTRSGGNYSDFCFDITSTGVLDFVTVGGAGVRLTTVEKITVGSWNHVALVRSNSVIMAFINGVKCAATVTYAGTITPATESAWVGGSKDPLYNTGYVSDLRVSKTALYTANFALPTGPLTAGSSTALLMNFTNATAYDSAAKLNVTTLGTSKVSPSTYKYGTASLCFDGSAGCYAKLPSGSVWNFGTSDFTAEFWYYKTAQAPANGRLLYLADGDVVCPFGICDNAGTLNVVASFDGTTWGMNLSSGSLTLSTWHHIVLRRVGSVFSFYLNGVLQGTYTNTAALYYGASLNPVIGGQGSPAHNVFGYIDDLRITKGKGRYTIEPTAELTL